MCDCILKDNLNGLKTIDYMWCKCYFVYKLHCLLISKEKFWINLCLPITTWHFVMGYNIVVNNGD
jgi:hypothetical protein